jgi:hypothetical protein
MATGVSDQGAITSSRELQQIKTRQSILPWRLVLGPDASEASLRDVDRL